MIDIQYSVGVFVGVIIMSGLNLISGWPDVIKAVLVFIVFFAMGAISKGMAEVEREDTSDGQ